jgi:hypothetical protein
MESSAVLRSVGSQINSNAAVHIQGLKRKDIEHFSDGMRARFFTVNTRRAGGLL